MALIALLFPPANVRAADIAAEVNGEPVTLRQVEEELARQLPVTISQFHGSDLRTLKRRMLDRIIDRKLLAAAAAARGFWPNAEALRQLLLTQRGAGPSSDLQTPSPLPSKELATDLAIARLVSHELKKNSTVTASDIADLRKDLAERPLEEIRVRHIFVSASDHETKRSEMLTLRDELQARPATFAAAAKRVSELPSRIKGGDLGYVTRNQLPDVLAQAAFQTPEGGVSELIEDEQGFHLFKVEARRLPESTRWSESELIADLRHKKQIDTISRLLEELRSKAKVIYYLG
jgi:peptidyl-prolyl cis-trans isomerase C